MSQGLNWSGGKVGIGSIIIIIIICQDWLTRKEGRQENRAIATKRTNMETDHDDMGPWSGWQAGLQITDHSPGGVFVLQGSMEQ